MCLKLGAGCFVDWVLPGQRCLVACLLGKGIGTWLLGAWVMAARAIGCCLFAAWFIGPWLAGAVTFCARAFSIWVLVSGTKERGCGSGEERGKSGRVVDSLRKAPRGVRRGIFYCRRGILRFRGGNVRGNVCGHLRVQVWKRTWNCVWTIEMAF